MTTIRSAAAHTELTPRLVDALYTEAMVLADDAHGYFDGPGRAERDALPVFERVAYSCESLRITTRLMHVIAWLLTRRAVNLGEIDAGQAAAVDRRLGEIDATDHATLAGLPDTARAIAEAAGELYDRVRRLDEGLNGGLGRSGAPLASPVSGMMARLQNAF